MAPMSLLQMMVSLLMEEGDSMLHESYTGPYIASVTDL